MRRLLIFTGDGKGKTSAALGSVLRAAGHGRRCLVVQFLKGDASTGEIAACSLLTGVEIVQLGLGFLPPEHDPEFPAHRKAALNALAYTERVLASGKYGLIVMDEVCGAVAKKLIDEERVLELLKGAPENCCIILTGRGAGARLIEEADTVTEMRCVRHGLQRGIKAQKGVEY